MKIAPHIDRFGDIRKMLVDYFRNVLLERENILRESFSKVLQERYGNPVVIKSEDEFHEFTDNVVYSFKFHDGLTVIDRFVSAFFRAKIVPASETESAEVEKKYKRCCGK